MRLPSIAVRALMFALAAGALSGCLATSVAGAAVGVAGAAVGVTAKAASTTVHVGHVAVDAVTPDRGDKTAKQNGAGDKTAQQDGVGDKTAQDTGGR